MPRLVFVNPNGAVLPWVPESSHVPPLGHRVQLPNGLEARVQDVLHCYENDHGVMACTVVRVTLGLG